MSKTIKRKRRTSAKYIAQMISIDGQSCGSLSHIIDEVPGSQGTSFSELPDSGDFPDYCRLKQVLVSGDPYTWELKILYEGGGNCDGFWWFRLETPDANDPEGNYCLYNGTNIECGSGEASINFFRTKKKPRTRKS